VATLVERERGETTVIVHDRALASDGLLLEAVSTVARLSAANASLNVQARGRLSDLTASRRRLLLAEEDERRRLSHRLHERTAPRLSYIERTLLPMVRDGVGEPSVVRLVYTALEQLRLARQDLNAIVRGLHPWESDGDLDQALTALAARTPIPVEVEVTGGPVGRELATAAYYVCSEAITNALKHAAAAHVHIEVHADGSGLTVMVSDDGTGGADPSKGSGLRGLADRVAALGGELTVDSPRGAGTRLVGTLPSEAGT
jgi:signal transduction histidine kinase